MKNLRVVYMGTPDFAVPCLERLVSEGYQIAAVVTQPDRPKGRGRKLTPSPVKETALKHNLPVWQPEKVKTPEFVAQLEALNPDVIIVVAFGQLLSPQILVIPEYGCINVHASLLPKYRGAAPIHWAVINGETETGVATMYMDAGLDTGDVILERTVSIDPEET
ncbi:MAG: fmt, partial [Firmicutes bacterium]|nr:fmt [Bacillota bacterium]